jgi:hypothetical protein
VLVTRWFADLNVEVLLALLRGNLSSSAAGIREITPLSLIAKK